MAIGVVIGFMCGCLIGRSIEKWAQRRRWRTCGRFLRIWGSIPDMGRQR